MRVGPAEHPIVVGAVAVDPRRPSGLNRYTMEFLRTAAPGSGTPLVALTSSSELNERLGGSARRVGIPALQRSDFVGNLLRLLWHQARLPSLLRRDRASLFFSPVPEGMLRPTVPQVVTLHDLLPLRFPEAYPRLKHYFRVVVPRILRASAAVIVVSRSTAEDIREMYGIDDVPIHVIYQGYNEAVFRPPGAGEEERTATSRTPGRYLLAVGETRPYKNMRRLIRAFAIAGVADLRLVIVGEASRRDPSLNALPAELGLGDRVRFLGAVSDTELAVLYAGATAFLFPSLHEGFGIPPLEAMACGAPVVASRAASIPEVCGDAALYVDPESTEEIAGAIVRVAEDDALRRDLRDRGLLRVRHFHSARASAEILEVLDLYRSTRS